MSRVGDSWTSYDTLFAEPFPEEADPSFSVQQQQFDFLSEKPVPFSERSISPPVNPEKTTNVFNSRKQKHLEENDTIQKKQKSTTAAPASLEVKEKDNRQKALEQLHALLRDHPHPGSISSTLADRYYNAVNLKFPSEFNNYAGIKTALRRYEIKYGNPCPDVSLDPEIAAALIGTRLSLETKGKAVGIINACLSCQPDFGLQNYIDIACQLLGIDDSSEKSEIGHFYQSNRDRYPAAEWTAELQQQIAPLMNARFSDAFVDEVMGQYAALKEDPLAIAILSRAYKKEFEGKVKHPYNKIQIWIRDRLLPTKTPPLNDKVKQMADTIPRYIGQEPSLQESEFKSVVGHVKACLEYCPNPQYLTEIFKLTKADCGVSASTQSIQRCYDKFRTKYPTISLSEETKLKLHAMKNQSQMANEFESNRQQAIAQYGALLRLTKSRPSPKHIKHLNVLNNKWPGAFSSINALISAYRRAPKTAPLDPDIKKAFEEGESKK